MSGNLLFLLEQEIGPWPADVLVHASLMPGLGAPMHGKHASPERALHIEWEAGPPGSYEGGRWHPGWGGANWKTIRYDPPLSLVMSIVGGWGMQADY